LLRLKLVFVKPLKKAKHRNQLRLQFPEFANQDLDLNQVSLQGCAVSPAHPFFVATFDAT
jgi:hypothetical protein